MLSGMNTAEYGPCDVAYHIARLRAEGELLADAAERAGFDAPVPACPDWRVRDLLKHLGYVHRWAAGYVREQHARWVDRASEAEILRGGPGDEALAGWFRDGHAALVRALEAADPGMSCWTFLEAPSPLAFWARRQAHETAVHRADVESAVGSTPAWAPAFAVDGVEELLRAFFANRPERVAGEPPVTVALSATDAEAAWTIRLDAKGLHVTDGAEPAMLAVSGTATELYLLLWNRIGLDDLVVDGDAGALDAWRGRATITWT